jgi:hypothetical protein
MVVAVAFVFLLAGSAYAQYLPGDIMQPWEGGPAYYRKWSHGPSSDPSFFPIAVWLQEPAHVDGYESVGINQYVGLWSGPTEAQLSSLLKRHMPVICTQNAVGLASSSNAVVTAWMHQDEPDNAQLLADGTGYGQPTPPSTIVAILA